jgi:hypothetical protein
MIRIALALLLTLLAGCPSETKRVLVIGDSITEHSFGALSREGNLSDPRVTYTSVSNSGIGVTVVYNRVPFEYWSELTANSIEGAGFDLVVVELGTNDCENVVNNGIDFTPEAILNNVQGVPVAWIETKGIPAIPQCASIINGELSGMGVTMLPYVSWITANPGYISGGIHHTEEGQAEYAKWVHGRVLTQLGN